MSQKPATCCKQNQRLPTTPKRSTRQGRDMAAPAWRSTLVRSKPRPCPSGATVNPLRVVNHLFLRAEESQGNRQLYPASDSINLRGVDVFDLASSALRTGNTIKRLIVTSNATTCSS